MSVKDCGPKNYNHDWIYITSGQRRCTKCPVKQTYNPHTGNWENDYIPQEPHVIPSLDLKNLVPIVDRSKKEETPMGEKNLWGKMHHGTMSEV